MSNRVLFGDEPLHVFERGYLTDVRYRDEFLETYVRLFSGARGPEFILMDDNARPHRESNYPRICSTGLNKVIEEVFSEFGDSYRNTSGVHRKQRAWRYYPVKKLSRLQ
ncbi:hypothetical protein TNCV_1577631 [Trichonephila clavipes]|nr:hypothetical protein TNCV_1577631 [Trichonephila clavipes]